MTGFIDYRFSDLVLYGFQGGPDWYTLIRDKRNGHKIRNQVWAMPHHRYSANYSLLDETEKEEVLSAFYAAHGRHLAFRFKDFNDYKARPANKDGAMALAIPASNTTPIQLTKTYQFGPSSYVRTITLPLNLQLFFDSGGGAVLFTDYAADLLTGLLTPTATWPAGTPSWTGEHDVRVCFARDFNPFSRDRPKTSSVMVDLEEDLG